MERIEECRLFLEFPESQSKCSTSAESENKTDIQSLQSHPKSPRLQMNVGCTRSSCEEQKIWETKFCSEDVWSSKSCNSSAILVTRISEKEVEGSFDSELWMERAEWFTVILRRRRLVDASIQILPWLKNRLLIRISLESDWMLTTCKLFSVSVPVLSDRIWLY